MHHDDIVISRVCETAPRTFREAVVSPSENSLIGFGENKQPGLVSIGAGLALVNGVLSSASSPIGVANTFADLPGDAANDSVAVVKTASGVWMVNRKAPGLYIKTADGWVPLA